MRMVCYLLDVYNVLNNFKWSINRSMLNETFNVLYKWKIKNYL